jgi:hypothetical protein
MLRSSSYRLQSVTNTNFSTMRGLTLSLLLLSAFHKACVTSACLRGSNSFLDDHEEHSFSPINKFLEKYFPGRSKSSVEKASKEAATDSNELSRGYGTIYFGNLAPLFEKDMTPSDQSDVDLSPSIEDISAGPAETIPEIDYDDPSSVENVYAQYGIGASYDTYDYQSYYADDDVENGMSYSPYDDYMKAEKATPLQMATVDGSSRSKVENLLAVIANLKFPMLFSISTSDREAIYIDGGIGDISQSSSEK